MFVLKLMPVLGIYTFVPKRQNVLFGFVIKIISLLLITGCHCRKSREEVLSAGQTEKPNSNYSVTDPKKEDYQAAHNIRVNDPYKELTPRISPNIPNQLKPHSRLVLTDVEDRTFFDFFAWQTFIGLVWPANLDYRGVPDRNIESEDFFSYNTTNIENPNRVPVVLETFHTFDAILPNTKESINNPPKSWNSTKYKRPFNLDLTSKGKSPVSLNEAFSSPLIDQNKNYVRYNLQLNEVMYEFIRQNKWYLKENLPKSPTQASLPPLAVGKDGEIISVQQPQTNTIITQPINGNSIEIKTAWRIMVTEEITSKPWLRKDDLSRYFVSRANVQDVVTGNIIENQLVGLVGLHIVVKTPQFSQGIWTSFEQVDNIKTPKDSGIRPSFNKGDGTFHKQGFSYQPDPIGTNTKIIRDSIKPVEVSRIYKIPDTPVGTSKNFPDGLSTVGLNKTYQKLLKGTVWGNYQLVITQWPTDPTTFYARPFLYPRGPKPIKGKSLPAEIEAYNRAQQNAKNAYPKWSGLPIPQVGALNTVMETYFQNPNPIKGVRQPMENTSCMGCHYGASDTDYSWGLKLRTYPQNFSQGRIHKADDSLLRNYIKHLPIK